MLHEKHLRDLMSSGLTMEQASVSTGHFSADAKWAKEHIGINREGLIFSYCDLRGKPYIANNKRFYRIKPDYKPKEEGKPKYLSPSGAGNKPYFSQIDRDLYEKSQQGCPILITEGEKKTDCLAAHGFFAIGLAGVYGWLDKSAREEETYIPPAQMIEDEKEDQEIGKLTESRLIPELREEINWEGRRVYIAFDSDTVFKRQVKTAIKDLAIELRKLRAFPYIIRIPNEVDGSKNGADDFIVRHGAIAFETIIEESQPALTQKNAFRFKQDPNRLTKILMAWTVLKDSWRYRPGMGFFRWNQIHWEPATPEEFERDLILFCDSQRWRDTAGMEIVLRQLKSRLLVEEKQWNPDRLLVFKNGTLDCMSNEFLPHTREDFCTSTLSYNYDLSLQCPNWKDFLSSALEGDDRAVSLIRGFLKWILTPKPSDRKAEIEKSLDIQGRKGTGKGTFLDILTELVGVNNWAAINCDTFNSPTSLSSCLDKKVLIDFDAHGLLKNTGIFNRIVSNEPVSCRYLYENPIDRRLRTVIVRAYNQYVDVPSGSEGLDRRIVAISFTNKERKLDPDLTNKLRAELPGIFAWAWSMPLDEAKEKILKAGSIKNVQRTSAERFEANNPEYVFLSDTFPDGNPRVKAGDLYSLYKNWARNLGYLPKGSRKFYEAIRAIGCKKLHKTNGCFFYDIPKMEKELSSYLGLGDDPASPGVEPKLPATPGAEPKLPGSPDLDMERFQPDDHTNRRIRPGMTVRYVGDNHFELQAAKGGTLNLRVLSVCDGIATVKAEPWYVNRQIPVSDLREI